MVSPYSPTGYARQKTFLVPSVTRTRAPLSTDIRDPATGKYYSIPTIWVDSTGQANYQLVAIVANSAIWEGATGTFTYLTIDGIASGYSGSEWEFRQAAVQTTDATPTAIITLAMASDSMVSVEARINGFRSTFAEATTCKIFAGGMNNGGSASLLNYSKDLFENSSGAPTVSAAVSGTDLVISVTGEVAKTINWVASYNYHYTLTSS